MRAVIMTMRGTATTAGCRQHDPGRCQPCVIWSRASRPATRTVVIQGDFLQRFERAADISVFILVTSHQVDDRVDDKETDRGQVGQLC